MGTSCDGTLIETQGIGFNTRRLPKTSFGVAKGYLGSEFRNEKPAAHPCSTFLFETPSGLLRAPWAPNSETKNPQLSLRVFRLLVTPSGFKPETF